MKNRGTKTNRAPRGTPPWVTGAIVGAIAGACYLLAILTLIDRTTP